MHGSRLLYPLHSPLSAAAPTGYQARAGSQEGAGRCPQGPGCPWTPERLSLPAQGSGPGGPGAGRHCCWPHHQGRRRRWRRCHHSCGRRPRLLHPRLHSAPLGAPVGEMDPGTGAATLWSHAGKGDAGDISRERGQRRGWGARVLQCPVFPQCPWATPSLGSPESAPRPSAVSLLAPQSPAPWAARSPAASPSPHGPGGKGGWAATVPAPNCRAPQVCSELSFQAQQLF